MFHWAVRGNPGNRCQEVLSLVVDSWGMGQGWGGFFYGMCRSRILQYTSMQPGCTDFFFRLKYLWPSLTSKLQATALLRGIPSVEHPPREAWFPPRRMEMVPPSPPRAAAHEAALKCRGRERRRPRRPWRWPTKIRSVGTSFSSTWSLPFSTSFRHLDPLSGCIHIRIFCMDQNTSASSFSYQSLTCEPRMSASPSTFSYPEGSCLTRWERWAETQEAVASSTSHMGAPSKFVPDASSHGPWPLETAATASSSTPSALGRPLLDPVAGGSRRTRQERSRGASTGTPGSRRAGLSRAVGGWGPWTPICCRHGRRSRAPAR